MVFLELFLERSLFSCSPKSNFLKVKLKVVAPLGFWNCLLRYLLWFQRGFLWCLLRHVDQRNKISPFLFSVHLLLEWLLSLLSSITLLFSLSLLLLLELFWLLLLYSLLFLRFLWLWLLLITLWQDSLFLTVRLGQIKLTLINRFAVRLSLLWLWLGYRGMRGSM